MTRSLSRTPPVPWTEWEECVLLDLYPLGGPSLCSYALPHRTKGSVAGKIQTLLAEFHIPPFFREMSQVRNKVCLERQTIRVLPAGQAPPLLTTAPNSIWDYAENGLRKD